MMNLLPLGRSGLRVSEMCLGTMTFGEDWGWGADKATSTKLVEQFAEVGGNFIDTAEVYTEGSSEEFVGDIIAHDRDHWVVATKYTPSRATDASKSGNSRKNMMRAVELSLKRLKTDYIDLYWVHFPDGHTQVDEIMRGLDDLVRSGKVHYIGFSDFPAWMVAQAATMADLRGWAPVTALQIEYSLIERTVEAELLPMARSLNLAITPWSPLAGGILTGKHLKGAEQGSRADVGGLKADDPQRNKIAQAVVDVAKEMGGDVTPAQVALAWVRQQPGSIVPILGARKPEQLADNLKALDVTLDQSQLDKLNEVSAPPPIFPHRFYTNENVHNMATSSQGGRILPHNTLSLR